MKIIFCVLLFCTLVCGKKELQFSNICKKYVISKIEDLWDDQSTGPITADSVINIKYSTVEDTEAEEPFDVTINYHTSKYMVFGYVPMPQAVHDLAGKALAELPNIKYLGNSNIQVTCPFKMIPGSDHCMPLKGVAQHRIPLKEAIDEIKDVIGRLAKLINGWFKIRVSGKTSFGIDAFCLELELQLKLA